MNSKIHKLMHPFETIILLYIYATIYDRLNKIKIYDILFNNLQNIHWCGKVFLNYGAIRGILYTKQYRVNGLVKIRTKRGSITLYSN